MLPGEISGITSMSDQIKAGIENVVHIVSPRFDASVESYLRIYFERNRTKTENMIGRSSMYFPMFEEHLQAAGLPVDLKYLAVVESAFDSTCDLTCWSDRLVAIYETTGT
jgi:hypothetical protein